MTLYFQANSLPLRCNTILSSIRTLIRLLRVMTAVAARKKGTSLEREQAFRVCTSTSYLLFSKSCPSLPTQLDDYLLTKTILISRVPDQNGVSQA